MELLTYIGLGTLALLSAILWRVMRNAAQQVRLAETLVRIEARLDEQGRRTEAVNAQLEHRALATQETVRHLDLDLRENHARLYQLLERRLGELQAQQAGRLADNRAEMMRAFGELREQVNGGLAEHRTRFEQRQIAALKVLNHSLQTGLQGVERQVGEALSRYAEELGRRVDGLTRTTDQRLQDIGGLVDRRLHQGFEKTTATFTDVLQRLALIDEAQKRIADLSENVVSLQEVLADKRSRGAFGEVQLGALVRNVLPAGSFALQHTLPNDTRADCVLALPEPTGRVVIDAKFPLESYRRMTDEALDEPQRREAARQFKLDIRRHIQDIAGKYIIPGFTSDGAVMFIPAEAVFAEIQAHHPDLVEAGYAARVWMCSPTTLMAVLNTARAVLKDDATRRQIHIIQVHLAGLAKDFQRFRKRMDNLARHIHQANRDVSEVSVSASKISDRFDRIERVELEEETLEPLPVQDGQLKASGLRPEA